MMSESDIRDLLKQAEKSVGFYLNDVTRVPTTHLGSYIYCKVRRDLLRTILEEENGTNN